MGRWKVLEEIALADCALEIEGKDLADLFETAAGALAHLMVEPTTLDGRAERAPPDFHRLPARTKRISVL